MFAADGLYLLLRLWMRVHVPTPPNYDYWYLLARPWQWWWWNQIAVSVGLLLTGPFVTQVALYAGLAVVTVGVVLVARSRRGMPRHALALALLLLLPLVLTGGVDSPRYGYMPSIGVILIAIALARLGWRGYGRWLTGGVLALWLLFQGVFSHFWIAEWGGIARGSEAVARLLASRPADEETVVLWIPASRLNLFLGRLHCVSQGLTDSIYPGWIKALTARGSHALPLILADALGDAVPETDRLDVDVVELHGDNNSLRLARPSVYTGGVSPNISAYVDLLAYEEKRVQLRLKRAPRRAFFTLTEQGWKQI
jgi:hypothetical protein